jgi:ferredoxin
MFARARLAPGSAEYGQYYRLRPENKAADDRMRALPGLLSPESREAHPHLFAATGATFDYIEHLRDRVDGPTAAQPLPLAPAAATAYVKGLAHYWGARAVGVGELQPYHVYSHVGRGTGQYGAPIDLDHRYAVAFTVEMAHEMVGTAPAAPTLLESARQYGTAAVIAILLADTLRAMGYPARAHVDGNYRLIAPLVAWDAGLGEFGRLGLLITPELGPRVRLGVVTTDLPLLPDGRRPDPSVLDFCTFCEKCARNCPVRAIPFGPRQEVHGALRWRIDQEICYRYWCVAGTDCARCVAVCPYSHPDSTWHNVIRWAARRSGPARRAIHRLDHLFYGARPQQGPAPAWLPPNPRLKRSTRPHA